jgi:uncharacterized repeat protein (TIGR02543 family)
MGLSTTIYAKWTINQYTVTFDANGGTGTMSPQSANYNTPTALTLNAFTRTSYGFSGWNTAANGSGTSYANGATYDFTANITLYAQWTANQYTVTFNANGGTGTMSPQSANYNTPTALTLNAFTKTGYSFSGWNTAANGSGTSYADGATYNFTADMTLYAQWTINTYQLTVTSTTGGTITTPASSTVTVNHGVATTITATATAGYTFTGWTVPVGIAAIANSSVLSTTATLTSGDATVRANFIEDAAYQVMYRSFSPELLGQDKDNKGKYYKYVARKPDKVEFTASVICDSPNVTDLHIEFSAKIDIGTAPLTVTVPPGATVTTIDLKLKKWDIVFASPIGTGQTVSMHGFAWNKKVQKISKFWWTRSTIQVGKSKSGRLLAVITNQPRLPMPNRINALYETMANKGAAYGPNGFVIGANRKLTVPDSGKYYSWLQTTKHGDLMKTLYTSKTNRLNTGKARGFDILTGKWTDMVKQQKSLPPAKFDNKLLAELIALKLNIKASAMRITPNGFGELIYNDGGLPWWFQGLMVNEIAERADELMMGEYDGTAGKKLFASPEEFAAIDSVVRLINGAFEGAIDTGSFGAELHFTGVRPLGDVPYLQPNPSVQPAVIVPLADNSLYSEPTDYTLYQNYPNPFNPTTTISFDLPEDAIVTLKIYNMLGQEVATLFDREELYNGTQEIEFSADGFASGVYFYRIVVERMDDDGAAAGTFQTVKKMILIK